MSADTQQATENAAALPAGRRRRPKRRKQIITAVVVIVIAPAAVGGYYEIRHLHNSAPAPPVNPDSTGLMPVTRQSLSEQTTVNGTLGYAGKYTILGSGSGAFTWLPADGQVVRQGQRLYSVGNSPVVLLYGSVPVYRSLSEGMTGPDVQQLNSDLVDLGDASKADLDPSSDYFGSATAIALDKLQSNLGLTQTGTLPVGQAVFQPSAVRVGTVTATLGAQVHAGAPVLTGTSDTRQAVAQVDPTQLPDVSVGSSVSITLPNSRTTPGKVTSIGTTANGNNSNNNSGGSSTPSATVDVDIALTDQAAAGNLDQAPITVSITTSTVNNVLAVPIDSLLSVPSGYAVEVAGPKHTRRTVPVTLGLFDDAAGLVQVSGPGLAVGDQVVVPKI